jgi:hypothetical protein
MPRAKKPSLLAAIFLVAAKLSWGDEPILTPPTAPVGSQTSGSYNDPRPCDAQQSASNDSVRHRAVTRLTYAIRTVEQAINEQAHNGFDMQSPHDRTLYYYWMITGVCSLNQPTAGFTTCITSYLRNHPEYILPQIKDGLTALKDRLEGLHFMCSPATGDPYCSIGRDPLFSTGEAEAYAANELNSFTGLLDAAPPVRDHSTVYICPAFRSDNDVDYRIQTLIHETAHLTSNSGHPSSEHYCSESGGGGNDGPYDCARTCPGNTMRSGDLSSSSIQADTWAHLAKCLARTP